MSGYTPVFRSILASTVWLERPHVKVVWWAMLLLCDRRGIVEGSVPGLAKEAVVTLDECREALAILMAPDPESRSKEHEGRRVLEVDGGWFLVNHRKYKDKLGLSNQANRERVARYRATKKAAGCNVTKRQSNDLDPRSEILDQEDQKIPPTPQGEPAAAADQVVDQSTQSETPIQPSHPPRPATPAPPPATSEPPTRIPPSESNVVPRRTIPTRTERVRTEWSDLSIQDLARRCRENPHDAGMAGPENRPEVQQVQRAWCEAVGLPIRSLGSLSPKNGALLAIMAALETLSMPDILRACEHAKRDDWAQGRQKGRDGSEGKKCRLEWMSLNVLRRLLDEADAAEAKRQRQQATQEKLRAADEAERRRERVARATPVVPPTAREIQALVSGVTGRQPELIRPEVSPGRPLTAEEIDRAIGTGAA